MRPRSSSAWSMRLHPGRVVRELVVAEVRLAGAGRDDQAVVRDLAAPAERLDGEPARVEVDTDHLAEHDFGVPLAAQDVPERRRDRSLREDAARHLVQERLEQMMIRPVDQHDLDVARAAERPCGEEAAEAAADDRDPVPSRPARHQAAITTLARCRHVARSQRHTAGSAADQRHFPLRSDMSSPSLPYAERWAEPLPDGCQPSRLLCRGRSGHWQPGTAGAGVGVGCRVAGDPTLKLSISEPRSPPTMTSHSTGRNPRQLFPLV